MSAGAYFAETKHQRVAAKTVAFGWGTTKRRRNDAPSEQLARIGWILLTLIFDGVVDYAACVDRFGISRREFQRDLLKLREIGKLHGFGISPMNKGRAYLQDAGLRSARLRSKGPDVADTLARIAAALGGPIESELSPAIDGLAVDRRGGFLQVRESPPADQNRVGAAFSFFKEAAAGPARVEFEYVSARGRSGTRRVEPYHVIERRGRYYLLGYDLGRRDWRHFALDAVARPWRKEGRFEPRRVPDRLLAERVVGWISGGSPTEVTVRFSALVGAAVTACTWQQGQRVSRLPDGGADVTLCVEDLGEVVRWALSYGTEALVIAPRAAVALARDTVARLGESYGEVTKRYRKLNTG